MSKIEPGSLEELQNWVNPVLKRKYHSGSAEKVPDL